MRDVIVVIFILVFVVWPIFKKIIEALAGGEEPQKKKESAQDIKEYLAKMRSSGQNQQSQGQYAQSQQYKAPATRPPASKAYDYKSKYTQKQPETAKSAPRKQAAKSVAQEVQEKPRLSETIVQPSLQTFAHEKSNEKMVPKLSVISKIISESHFSDVQKAVIFCEVFGKPKSL